jgi:vacuolar-type H+-ATPase subunit H
MAVQNNRSLGAEHSSSERSRGVSLAPVGQRVVNFLRGPKIQDDGYEEQQPTGVIEDDRWPEGEEVLPRFPLARRGYHCAAVDSYVAELEQELAEVDRELAELRAQSAPRDEVSIQIKRVGEQTSAVLIAANEQRDEMLRTAREEADRQVADATAKATLITANGEARLRELHSQHAAAGRERERLLDEVRSVSVALASLADSDRTPALAQSEQATLPTT